MRETFVILHNSPTGLKIEEAPGHNRESATQRAKELAATGGQVLVMQVVGAVHGSEDDTGYVMDMDERLGKV